jgi:hypothetical protein
VYVHWKDFSVVVDQVGFSALLFSISIFVADSDDDDDWDEEDYFSDEDEDLYTDCGSEGTDGCRACNLHANYWTDEVNKERVPLRDCVEKCLFSVFKQTPSLRLYRCLTSINVDSDRTVDELFKVLQDVAGDSPDNLAAALDIYVYDVDFDRMVDLLENYMHLFRPRDMVTLQCAVAMLLETPHRKLALSIFEAEVGDSLQAIYVAVRTCFARTEEDSNKAELTAILKLKPGSSARKTRVESWGEKVFSNSDTSMGPMAFAAMMIGLPVVPGSEEGDDSDVLNYIDLDRNDPDFDDLRDEFRPDLKARFDGWVQLGQNGMAGAKPILMKLYTKAIELMPYLRSQDVVNEMVAR